MRTRVKAAGAAALALTAMATSALAAAPTTRDFARIVRLSDPHVSPDGKSVILVESRADLDDDKIKSELFLVDLQSRAVRPFTRGREHAGAPAWAPDGSAVAFLAPDKDKHLQVFVAPMTGGDAQQLTHAKDDVSQFAWRPDGKAIAFAVADEGPELKGEARFNKLFKVGHVDFTQTEPQRPTHLWLIDLGGGDARRLTTATGRCPRACRRARRPRRSSGRRTASRSCSCGRRRPTPATRTSHASRSWTSRPAP